ncbi:MAG: zinc ribbon domain-containing protein [Candidatus Thiodiazotropha sp. (ex Lucinoma kastoroae)]|nr:zinc ribbon domain-containing protein [Candidatus Thiodiazotropha sp. (ex Lucinoma kastoroae)]MCU7861635.1 zinc ribbon domain-containing protein [Candidatus Thiodiazotropha sp. (ex Lucinoma kastoroae)]
MKLCRECKHKVSEQATACPNCGAPYPAKAKWDGWGFEYKSETIFLGLPLLHVSFKFRPNRVPVPAKGVFAIGQFAYGIFTLSQFGVGVVSISQFTIAGYALAQFAFAYSLIAQFGIYLNKGQGQLVMSLGELLGML